MLDWSPYIITAVVLIGIFALFLLIVKPFKGNNKPKKSNKFSNKDRKSLLKEANRRLSQNPKDPEALQVLADIHYKDENWEKANKTYSVLLDMCATNPDLDEFQITLRHALSAMKLKQYEEAQKGLLIARSMKQDVFEVNSNLGFLEYNRRNYEKAVGLLRQAQKQEPEHVQTLRYLGHSLYKMKNYKEALTILKKAVELEPDDKDSLFAAAECYHELGMNEQATQIFTHLRPDPRLGPSAALFAGTIHLNNKDAKKAIMDFEIGLKHESMRPEVMLELKYRLASAYIKQQDISRALRLFEEIYDVHPNYKDVSSQIRKYQELNMSKNLQKYLMAPSSEFVVLCRKLVNNYFSNAKVKIVDVSVHNNEYADILADISTRKWEDQVLFRFIRSTGHIGELLLRDLNSRTKEIRAGRAFCITAGKFSESAQQFVEARLIDLVEKDDLKKILNKLEAQASVK